VNKIVLFLMIATGAGCHTAPQVSDMELFYRHIWSHQLSDGIGTVRLRDCHVVFVDRGRPVDGLIAPSGITFASKATAERINSIFKNYQTGRETSKYSGCIPVVYLRLSRITFGAKKHAVPGGNIITTHHARLYLTVGIVEAKSDLFKLHRPSMHASKYEYTFSLNGKWQPTYSGPENVPIP